MCLELWILCTRVVHTLRWTIWQWTLINSSMLTVEQDYYANKWFLYIDCYISPTRWHRCSMRRTSAICWKTRNWSFLSIWTRHCSTQPTKTFHRIWRWVKHSTRFVVKPEGVSNIDKIYFFEIVFKLSKLRLYNILYSCYSLLILLLNTNDMYEYYILAMQSIVYIIIIELFLFCFDQ